MVNVQTHKVWWMVIVNPTWKIESVTCIFESEYEDYYGWVDKIIFISDTQEKSLSMKQSTKIIYWRDRESERLKTWLATVNWATRMGYRDGKQTNKKASKNAHINLSNFTGRKSKTVKWFNYFFGSSFNLINTFNVEIAKVNVAKK